jgi:Tfp pilus assembly protein PilZ
MRPDERVLDSDPSSFANRRRGRVEVVATICSEILPQNVPITLLNVSHGGFLMRSPMPYAVDDMHKFRFTIPGEPYPIVLRGRVRHLTAATTNGVTAYAIGVQFIDQQVTDCQQAIQRLVGAASRRQ